MNPAEGWAVTVGAGRRRPHGVRFLASDLEVLARDARERAER